MLAFASPQAKFFGGRVHPVPAIIAAHVFILCYMNEYLSLWYILAENGTGRHVIMMHYGNGDKPNVGELPALIPCTADDKFINSSTDRDN